VARREIEVLKLIVDGHTGKEIAERLNNKNKTINN
jgi:DNA-binding NarL/FixJ family response regulator